MNHAKNRHWLVGEGTCTPSILQLGDQVSKGGDATGIAETLSLEGHPHRWLPELVHSLNIDAVVHLYLPTCVHVLAKCQPVIGILEPSNPSTPLLAGRTPLVTSLLCSQPAGLLTPMLQQLCHFCRRFLKQLCLIRRSLCQQ